MSSTSKVFAVREVVNRGGQAIDLRKLATKLDAKGEFQRFTWRTGSRGDLSASLRDRISPLSSRRPRRGDSLRGTA